jgi:hypothetical protein
METALYIIAGGATLLFLAKLVLMLIGFDGAADGGDVLSAVDTPDAISAHDLSDVSDFKIFTLMTFIVTFMVGGWVALLFLQLGWNDWLSAGAGGAIGFASGVVVSYAIFSMRRLEHDGTLRNFEAKGVKGTCYIRVPEAGAGKGQVQVTIKGRLFTFDAVSDGPEIPSFKPVVVMERVDEKTLRVCPTE